MYPNVIDILTIYRYEKYIWFEINVPIMLSLLNIKLFTIKLLVVYSLSEHYKMLSILISNY